MPIPDRLASWALEKHLGIPSKSDRQEEEQRRTAREAARAAAAA